MSDEEYVEELRLVRRKKGTVRSRSSKSDEFESDLLRDGSTRNVAGPTESRPVDEEEMRRKYRDPVPSEASGSGSVEHPMLTSGQQALADAIAEVGAHMIEEVIVPILLERVVPAARSKFSQYRERRRAKAAQRAGATALTRKSKTITQEAQAPPDADLEPKEPSIPMSRGDFLLAQLQLKSAQDYTAELRWRIAHAEVDDDKLSPSLERAFALLLEGRADELDDELRQALVVFIHGQHALDGLWILPTQPRSSGKPRHVIEPSPCP